MNNNNFNNFNEYNNNFSTPFEITDQQNYRCKCSLVPIISMNMNESKDNFSLDLICPDNHKTKNISFESLKIDRINCKNCGSRRDLYILDDEVICFQCMNKDLALLTEKVENKGLICFKHNQKIVKYCKNHNNYLCNSCQCTLLDLDIHNYIDIDEFNEEEINTISEDLNVSESFVENISSKLNKFISNAEKLKKNIKNYVELNKKQIQIAKNLIQFYKNTHNTQNYISIKNIINFNNLEYFDDYINKYIEKGDKILNKFKNYLSLDKLVLKFSNNLNENENYESEEENNNNINNHFLKRKMKLDSSDEEEENNSKFKSSNNNFFVTPIGDDVNIFFNLKQSLNFEKDTITFISLLNKNFLAAATLKGEIKIFNKNYKKIYSFSAHESQINYLCELSNKNLISCSNDKKIKIFNFDFNFEENSHKLIDVLEHKRYVFKVIELKNKNLVSISLDKTIKIWNKELNDCYLNIQTIELRISLCDIIEINCFSYSILKEDFYVLAAISNTENKLIFIDYETKKEIFIYENIRVNNKNQILFFYENNLLIAGDKNMYLLLDVSGKREMKIIPISFSANCVSIIYDLVISGDRCGNIHQFKLKDNNLTFIKKKKIHGSKQINCILKSDDNSLLFTCSYINDNSIKIWKVDFLEN